MKELIKKYLYRVVEFTADTEKDILVKDIVDAVIAEKIALIDKLIEEYEKEAYNEAITRPYLNTSEKTEGKAQGLEKAKSILQGDVV